MKKACQPRQEIQMVEARQVQVEPQAEKASYV